MSRRNLFPTMSASQVVSRIGKTPKRRNPLLVKPNVDLSKHHLNRAGEMVTRRVQLWLGQPNADLYAGVHVSPSPSTAAAYALNRLKIDADNYEVTDAPVLIGLSASCQQPDLGDVDVLTLAEKMYGNLLDKAYDLGLYEESEDDEYPEMDWLSDSAASEEYEAYLGLEHFCGNFANYPDVHELYDAMITLVRSPEGASKEDAIALAKALVPQQRWGNDVPDSCVVAVVVLPPYKPGSETAENNAPFPYDESADEEFDGEPIDRDRLDSFIRRGWKVLWGDPSKAAFWHGTSASLAAKAFPAIVNQHAANELCFDPAPYREDLEDLEQNPAPRTFIPPPAVAAEARKGITLRASQPPSNRCCTPVGLRRAVQLANRQPVSETTLRRMKAYFDRHYGPDSRGKGWGVDSRGWQAHLCWGGDAGRKWVESILGGR